MKFVGRINAPFERFPLRAYIGETGFNDAYQGNIKIAADYILEVLDKYSKDFHGTDFLLAILWGHDGKKCSDVFGLSDISGDKWPENATVHNWIFDGSDFIPQSIPRFGDGSEKTCEDSMIILGHELQHRRWQKDLAQYTANPYPLNLSIPIYTVDRRGLQND